MSVTRGQARRLQNEGPGAAWWPSGEQPTWARVTPDDLVAVDLSGDDADGLGEPALWRLSAFDDEREVVEYDLALVSLGRDGADQGSGVDGAPVPMFVCRDAGAVVKFRDDITFETGDDAQPLDVWFAWLQRRDALMAAEPMSDEWAGGDVDMQIERADANVVAMGEQSAVLSVFDSVAAVREWAARLSPKPLVPLEIMAFDALGWFAARKAGSTDRLTHEFHETSDDDPSQVVVKWVPMEVKPASAQSWFGALDGYSGASYLSGYSTGGGQVSAFAVERALAWGEVAPFVRDEFDPATPTSQRWIVVRMAGMLSGIAVPCDGSFVTWMTDGDGASFLFRADEAEKSVARARAEQDFRLKWARWFDTDEPLSRDELARGLAAIEATMKEFS